MSQRYFTPKTFTFLRTLAAHNERDWFRRHRAAYDQHVAGPGRQLLTDLRPHLAGVSPYMTAGAVIRIQRDLRFTPDKTPYKTYTGMYIRHCDGSGSRSPGFYLRLGPGDSHLRVGMAGPAAKDAAAVRRAMAEDPQWWETAAHSPDFAAAFTLDGGRLLRPPAGFGRDHPLIADLMRKDFTGRSRLTQRLVTSDDFLDALVGRCRLARPFLAFVCGAVGLPF